MPLLKFHIFKAYTNLNVLFYCVCWNICSCISVEKVRICGTVSFSPSTCSEGEIFFALKDTVKVTARKRTSDAVTWTSFGLVLHVARKNLSTGIVFPAVLGNCTVRQSQATESTLTLKDDTGYAVIALIHSSV